MTQNERENLERDYALYLWLLDYYTKNRDTIKSMSDKEFTDHIDAILDELNRIKRLLDAEKNKNDR